MTVKTQQEIEKLAEGGKLLHGILEEVIAKVKVGVHGLDLSDYAEQRIRDVGGMPAFKGYGNPPFPAALCVSINDCVVHGIPLGSATSSALSDKDPRHVARPFQAGDIIGLDIGMIYKGLYTDMARTIALGDVSKDEKRLIKTAKQALEKAIAVVRPGTSTGDIGSVVQTCVEKQGFGVVRDLAGHGVGYELHEDPEVPNYGKRGAGTKLLPGMVIAIEPMITLGDWRVKILDDGWSVVTRDGSKTAHFEDTIAVTESGSRILTR